jgi:hypothetical protein
MSASRARFGLLVGALALPLLLSGCSGTPFGEALSRSFSPPGVEPPEPPALPKPSAELPAGTSSTATKPPLPAAQKPQAGAATSKASTAPATGRAVAPPSPAKPTSPPPPAAPSNPVPYRVTLRLPAADPAAPAEVVTQALRAAGVPFEVETIERLPRNGPPAPATPAAPTPPASPAPAARPAPAPR